MIGGTDLTDYFVARLRDAHEPLKWAVSDAARTAGNGFVDGYELWKRLDGRHELTYLQYSLRESEHVCRHQVAQGVYRVHTAARCGSECRERWEPAGGRQTPRGQRRCPSCYVDVTTHDTECGICGEEL